MSELFSSNEEAALEPFDLEMLNAPQSNTPGVSPLISTWSRSGRRALTRRTSDSRVSQAFRPRTGAGYPDFH